MGQGLSQGWHSYPFTTVLKGWEDFLCRNWKHSESGVRFSCSRSWGMISEIWNPAEILCKTCLKQPLCHFPMICHFLNVLFQLCSCILVYSSLCLLVSVTCFAKAFTHTHSLTWAVSARAGGAVRMSVLHFRHTENIWSGVDHSATRVCRDQSHDPLLPLRRCSWHRVCACVCFTINILTVVHALSWACVYSVFKSSLNTWIQVFVLVYACVLCVRRCRICSALNTWTVNMAP